MKTKKIRMFLISICALFLILSITLIVFPRKTFYSVTKNSESIDTIEIFGNNVVSQQFDTGMLSLNNVYINLAAQSNYNGTASLTLFHDEKQIYNSKYTYDQIKDGVIRINLDGYSVNSNDNFYVEIKCEDCTESLPLVLNTSNEINKNDALKVNGVSQKSAVTMSLYGKHNNYSYAILCSFIYLFLLFILLFCYIDKSKKKKIYLCYVLEFVFSILTMFLFINNFCNYVYMFKVVFMNYVLFIGCLSILMYLFVSLIKTKLLSKEKLYLALAIPLALCYAILMIPNHVADEPVHFARAYDLINNNIFSTKEKVKVPADFVNYNMGDVKNYKELNHVLFNKTNYSNEVSFGGAPCNYCFMLYFFADIGILIGKLFSLPIFITYYLARIFNVCFMLLCGYYIVKFIPFGKVIALTYLLNPMYLHQGASVSADSIVNSVCLLFIAVVLNLRENKKISTLEIFLLVGLVLSLGLAKYIYIPLVLLLLMLIKNKSSFSQKNRNIIVGSAVIAISLCAFSILMMYLIPSAESGIVDIAEGVENISMVEQIKCIILNPIYTVKCLGNTLFLKSYDYFVMFFGMRLGWLSIGCHPLIILLYAFLLLTSPYIYHKNEYGFFDKKDKLFCNGLCIVLLGLSILSMWLYWTPVGGMPVQGVQGRYFLPFMLLCLLTLSNKSQKITINMYDYKISIVMVLIHVMVFFSIIYYFM